MKEDALNPAALVLVALAAVLSCVLPRRLAFVPFIVVAPLIPMGQAISIGPFTFYMARLLLAVLWLRILILREHRFLKHSPIDTLILLQFACGLLAYVTLRGTTAALVNRLGWTFDAIGIYFAARWLIRDSKIWEYVLKSFAIVCLVISIGMLIEYRTGNNLFSMLGNIAETEVRDGKIRSQGPFGHSILAGVFAGNLIALFAFPGWRLGRRSLIQLIGLASIGIIVVTSSSSTPFMGCAAGLLGIIAWLIRRNMRLIRWGIIISLAVLQLMMNDPVWAILAKVKVFGGSTGWYRYYLLDNFIRRFAEWCFLGVESTAAWGRGLWDVTMMYVRVGVDGGLITFILFIAVLVQCYMKVGRTVRALPSKSRMQKVVWALGAALTSHIFSFFGVNYWDQNVVPWYVLLAVIAGSSELFHEHPAGSASTPTSGSGWFAVEQQECAVAFGLSPQGNER